MDSYEQRKVANTEVDGGVVDTVAVSDCPKPYETGINHPAYNNGQWIIVDYYTTRAQAEKGHKRWVKLMRKKPESLSDINECNIETLAKILGTTTRGVYKRR